LGVIEMHKIGYFALALLLMLMPGLALGDGAVMEELGTRAAAIALENLSISAGDEGLLALTDAGHAVIAGQTTQRAIKGITTVSGCSIGDGNLFQVLRAHWKPLWFFFFDKTTGEAVFIQVNEGAAQATLDELKAMSDDEVFTIVNKVNANLDYMLSHTDEGNATFNDKLLDGNEFSLVGIANTWAHPNCTFDFIQAACFHDHLCPGVTSGYMITKYVEDVLPITGPAESYKVIACPNWCKDDAIQMIWDATPGKSGMFVMALSPAEDAGLQEKYGTRVAGVYVRWNATANMGDGLVLGFTFDKAYELTGTANWTGPSWGSKLVMDVSLIDYWNQPELFASTIKEFPVDPETLSQLQNAGMHPLKVAGIM